LKLGLRKPDPPKIKLSNMMRILGTEAVIDPSKAEKEVRKQM
jgi:U4/U6 small nuclear ribonucleoprotein PRP3